jgi:hypothetical protein
LYSVEAPSPLTIRKKVGVRVYRFEVDVFCEAVHYLLKQSICKKSSQKSSDYYPSKITSNFLGTVSPYQARILWECLKSEIFDLIFDELEYPSR